MNYIDHNWGTFPDFILFLNVTVNNIRFKIRIKKKNLLCPRDQTSLLTQACIY